MLRAYSEPVFVLNPVRKYYYEIAHFTKEEIEEGSER